MQIQVSSPVSAAITKSIQEAYMSIVDYVSLITFETYRVNGGTQELVHWALTIKHFFSRCGNSNGLVF